MKIVTKHAIHPLSFCITAILLSACGGNSDQAEIQPTANNSTAPAMARMVMAVATDYPEPVKDVFDSSTVGFYDADLQGNSRFIRNDLSGNLAAMIQFAQDHTVDPRKRCFTPGHTHCCHG